MKLTCKTILSLVVVAASIMTTACSSRSKLESSLLTDPLDASAWQTSTWLSAANAPVFKGQVHDNSCAPEGASWFMSTVRNERRVKAARWMTAGLGVYELYVNGQLIGSEVLKPGFTHPLKTKRSFTYDVTPALRRGAGDENVLSVQVTPGWWGDKVVTPGGNGMWGTKCAFRGVLELTYSDGSKRCFATNTDDWRAGIAGPVKQAGIFEGERYDAREPMGYARADLLTTPEVNTEFKGEVLPNDGAEIYLREDLALSPVEAYCWQGVQGASEQAYGKVIITREFKPGMEMSVRPGETLVVDFGQNAAAVPAFEFKAKEGTVLTCLPAELLNDGNGAKERGMDGPEGSCHRQNLRTADRHMQLHYTFAATKDYASYHPHCTFYGYRYVSITATDEVHIRSIRSIPVTSISKEMETGTITTGNELVNRLISNTIWGQRSNYLSVPTDCPQRNERQGWTADTQVFTETGAFFANTDRFFHKWMRDMRDTQSDQGSFPGVAPLGQYNHAGWMRLGWADAGIIVPWTVWRQFDDRAIIDENWEAMERFMNHINETKYDHKALSAENDNYQWADWLSYEPLESCGGGAFGNNGPKPEALIYWSYLGASYWAIDAAMMADMAAATGRDADKYRKMTDAAKDYLREQFLNDDGTFKTDIFNTMQTPALFALKNQLVKGEAKDRMIARLRQNFADHEGCLQTGFLGTSILMETLTQNGMADVAYELLLQRKNPSWLYSIDNGATTIWERWNSYTKDKGMGPSGMNSFNHYAYGSVCAWIWKTVAGIAPDAVEPGFKHIIMRPIPDKRLGFVNAEYHSAAGLIKSAWRYDGDLWSWTFTIPKGSSALVFLPGETVAKQYGSGTHKIRMQL